MATNTFSPYVGGLVRSIEAFTSEFRRRGHRVLVVAPAYPGSPKKEAGVVRIPSIRRFNGSDFSIGLPIPGFLYHALEDFRPEIVHSHHPYVLGDMALRISASRNIPLVFTHHTMYEMMAHYVVGDSPAMRRFVVELSTGYANLCDRVIAPSGSTARILRERGVTAPIGVIPTGVNPERFRRGDRDGFRAEMGIPAGAFVVGHVGRLGPEKNLGFLVQAVTGFLAVHRTARFLVVGAGPSEAEIRDRFERCGMTGRLHYAGVLRDGKLADAYHAMDVFAFSSRNETQGMVLTEAMASGVPVVAVDAPGVREAVEDGRNGFLLSEMSLPAFTDALLRASRLPPADFHRMREAARETSLRYSIHRCAEDALRLYENVLEERSRGRVARIKPWARRIGQERMLWRNRALAAVAALSSRRGMEDAGAAVR
ncbi:MAG: glycosyltransferase [Thermodesulfobacteriota bacterium]